MGACEEGHDQVRELGVPLDLGDDLTALTPG
jgi:hypothetical protein